MITLNNQNLEQVVEKSTKPVIIDVFATWCGPCKYMAPILDELEEELGDKYTFAKFNVEESRDLAIKYGVTSFPTFIFIKDNKVIGKVIGARSKEDFQDKIELYFA